MTLLARFANETSLIEAAAALRAAGVEPLETFMPYPLEQMEVGVSPVPVIVLIAGLGSFVASLSLQIYAATVGYPQNIGGRPLNSWLAFIPTAFENGVLFAVLAGFFSFLFLSWRPAKVNEAPGEGYWLAVGSEARAALEATRPAAITEARE
jgi:hypothetical protein